MARRKKAKRAARPKDAADALMRSVGFAVDRFVADERAAALAELTDAPTARTAARAAERAALVAEEQLRLHLEVIRPDPPIACGEACAFCCYLRAQITLAEAARVALHLRATRSPAELEAVAARVRETADRVGELDLDARAAAHVPCSLLVDGKCSVYEARPLVCRGCNSSSAEACEAALDDPEVEKVVYAPQKALFNYAGTALARALADRGLSGVTFELNRAVDRALSRGDDML